MHTLVVLAVILAIGALATVIGSWLIGRAHPPHGRFVKVQGMRQHVVELGEQQANAPPIVLIHGAGCNLEDMRLDLGERLAAQHRVILIDRPGMGWSKRKGRHGSAPQFQAAILCEVLDQLGVARAIIVGHSWGGALAVSFALDYPDRTAALILLASPFYPLAHPTTSLYALFAMPVLGWIYARTLALPLGLAFIGLALGSAFLPQLPPRVSGPSMPSTSIPAGAGRRPVGRSSTDSWPTPASVTSLACGTAAAKGMACSCGATTKSEVPLMTTVGIERPG